MKDIITQHGSTYLRVTSGQIAKTLAAQYADLAKLSEKYDLVLEAERQMVGACPDVSEGWERLIELDAQALFESDFSTRWANWKNRTPPKFELYPVGDYGNCVYQQRTKPLYDEQRKALQFVVSGLQSGSPSLGTRDASPAFGIGDNNSPRYIRSHVTLRWSMDLEFSPNMFEMLLWAKANNARVPWLTLVQQKNHALSWYTANTWLLGWNRMGERLYLLVRGDTRTEKPDGFDPDTDFENYHVIRLECPLGRRVSLECEQRLDPTGGESFTRIWWDGQEVLDNAGVNCVPAEGYDPRMGCVRGLYFGTYMGNTKPLPEPFSVWYSNMRIDCQEQK